jgi:hypothetical protein
MDMMLWNAGLSIVVGLLGFFLREKSNELSRLSILLNKTREEVAKEYVTKVEVHADINRVLDRLDRLDNKIDTLIKEHRSAIS